MPTSPTIEWALSSAQTATKKSYLQTRRGSQALTHTLCALILGCLICPILISNLDASVAIFTRTELSPFWVTLSKKVGNVDDYILILCALSSAWCLYRKQYTPLSRWLFPMVAALSSGILTQFLKGFFGRIRPKGLIRYDEYGFEPFHFIDSFRNSFPSGHTSSAMALMTAIALLFPAIRIPCFLVALLLGIARIGAGAHFPADVVAGLIIGYCITLNIFNYSKERNWI